MKQNHLIFTMLIITTLLACKKTFVTNKTISNSEYVIFGHFYGECLGEKCIEIYKLGKSQLFEDIKDSYPSYSNFYSGSYNLLSQNKFDASKDIMDYFPQDLLNEPNNVIGQPDAGDWGGLYIEYNFNGVRKLWLIDLKKGNVPIKYHKFIDEVKKRILING